MSGCLWWPHSRLCVNAWPWGAALLGTVPLLEVSPWGWALRSLLQLHPVWFTVLLPVDLHVELSAPPPAPCLSARYHDANGLKL